MTSLNKAMDFECVEGEVEIECRQLPQKSKAAGARGHTVKGQKESVHEGGNRQCENVIAWEMPSIARRTPLNTCLWCPTPCPVVLTARNRMPGPKEFAISKNKLLGAFFLVGCLAISPRG